MAVLVLLPFLPSTALAAFYPDFAVFLACGASSNVSFPRDSPARTFTPDAAFLTRHASPAPAGQFLVLRLHFFPFAAASQPATAAVTGSVVVSGLAAPGVATLWRRQARRGVGRGVDGEPAWPAGVAAAP
jgi:hypothetical protein